MKPLLYSIYSVILTAFLTTNVVAQKASSCDGKRYIQDIFTDTIQYKGFPYGSNKTITGNVTLYMDVIEPKGDTVSKRPLIIWAFGGGFVQGTRTEQYMLDACAYFAKKGYVCATIDYRLYSFLNGIPDSNKISPTVIGAVHDMKGAIRFFRKDAQNGNKYRIDTSNILVAGFSAGAITAMHTAQLDSTDTMSDWIRNIIKNEGGFEGNSGNSGYSSSVKAALSFSGGLYQKEFIDKNDVPFMAYHGTADDVVPNGRGLNVYRFYTDGDSACNAYARSLGIRSSLVTVPGGGHSDIYDFNGKYAANLTDFLTKATLFLKQVVCEETITLPTQEIENQAFKLSPNPSSDEIILTIDSEMSQSALKSIYTERGYRISVFDAMGRQVFSAFNVSNESFILKKSDIGKGLFFVNINWNGAYKPITRKIVFE